MAVRMRVRECKARDEETGLVGKVTRVWKKDEGRTPC
jgi:hypothetical protein